MSFLLLCHPNTAFSSQLSLNFVKWLLFIFRLSPRKIISLDLRISRLGTVLFSSFQGQISFIIKNICLIIIQNHHVFALNRYARPFSTQSLLNLVFASPDCWSQTLTMVLAVVAHVQSHGHKALWSAAWIPSSCLCISSHVPLSEPSRRSMLRQVSRSPLR